ncbi:MAG TPA: hypothetical protein VKA84_16385 [Gemmatimonadaceae bacterium]|nr:hypothetical protein [Gemmatimonadaceae bacterium]
MSENRAQNTKQAWVTPVVTELPGFTELTLQSGGLQDPGGGGPIISSITGGSGTFSFV